VSAMEVAQTSVETEGGFVIESLELKGFMRYLTLTDPPIRFEGQFTAITGRTGSGKTSLLDAITFALYKRSTRMDPPANLRVSEICRPSGSVKVSFRQGKKRYVVTRGLDAKGESYLELTEDGKRLHGSISELEGVLRDVIGLDYDGFRNSTFVRQEEMRELGSQTGARRVEIFQKLFRLEMFERALKEADARHRELARELEVKRRELETRRELAAKRPLLQGQISTLEWETGTLQKKMDGVKEKETALLQELRRQEAAHEEHVRLSSRKEAVEKERQGVAERLRSKEEQLKGAFALSKELEALEKQLEGYEARKKEGEVLRDLQQKYRLVAQQRDSHMRRRGEIEGDFRQRELALAERYTLEERRLRDLKGAWTKDEAFAGLRMEGILEERLRRINREAMWLKDRLDILAQLRKEKEQAMESLKYLKPKIEKLGPEVFLREEIELNLLRVRQETEDLQMEYQARLEAVEQEISPLEEVLKGLRFDEKKKARLLELRDELSRLEGLRKQADELTRKQRQVGDAKAALEELRNRARALDSEMPALVKLLEGLVESEKAYGAARDRREELAKEREGFAKELYGKQGALEELLRQMEGLKAQEERIGALEKEIEGGSRRAEVLALLKDGVFHKRGIVRFAINQLLPQLSIETSKNVAELTDSRFTKAKLEAQEEGREHGILIEVQGVDGAWHDVSEFSGGEKTQINAALRFAIAKELASLPQVGRTYGRMKTLFIDEGDLGSLDTESSRELFTQKLFRMGEFFEKVILITHLTEVAERFPHRIHVTMTPKGESRAEAMASP